MEKKMITAMETKFPRLVTALPGPKALAIVERDAKFMSPSFTRDYPLVAKSGHGAMVEDVDGNLFLDFAAGVGGGVCGGDCGLLDRTLPSESSGGDPEAGCGTDPHVRYGFLLRELAVFGGKAR